MRRLCLCVGVSLAVTSCGGASGTPASTSVSPTSPTAVSSGIISPPNGTTTWVVTYRPATAFTCPAVTPASGSTSMSADGSGNSLTLTDLGTSLSGIGPSTITFIKDGTGKYLWVDPTGRANISFKFTSQSHADGEAMRTAAPGDPCSATWPFFLDR